MTVSGNDGCSGKSDLICAKTAKTGCCATDYVADSFQKQLYTSRSVFQDSSPHSDKMGKASSLTGDEPILNSSSSSDFGRVISEHVFKTESVTFSSAMNDIIIHSQPLDLSMKTSSVRCATQSDDGSSVCPSGHDTYLGCEIPRKRGIKSNTNCLSSLQSLQDKFGNNFAMDSTSYSSAIPHLQSPKLLAKECCKSAALREKAHSCFTAPSNDAKYSPLSRSYSRQPATAKGHKSKSLKTAVSDCLGKVPVSGKRTVRQSDRHIEHIPDVLKGREDRMKCVATSSWIKCVATSSWINCVATSSWIKCVATSTSSAGIINGSSMDNDLSTFSCSCRRSFCTLYGLRFHLQDTGHAPCNKKQLSTDYPKLVRGQDMWLNQDSEQTRRILRCMQCGESFNSLPLLTTHMMETGHCSKMVSADVRRSHKYAYCGKELDKDSIFKCKICKVVYSDMEGLAKHMIVSGHHKKSPLRPHVTDSINSHHVADSSSPHPSTSPESQHRHNSGQATQNILDGQKCSVHSCGQAALLHAERSPSSECCDGDVDHCATNDCLFHGNGHKCTGQSASTGSGDDVSHLPTVSAERVNSDHGECDNTGQLLPSTKGSDLFRQLTCLTGCDDLLPESAFSSTRPHPERCELTGIKDGTDPQRTLLSDQNVICTGCVDDDDDETGDDVDIITPPSYSTATSQSLITKGDLTWLPDDMEMCADDSGFMSVSQTATNGTMVNSLHSSISHVSVGCVVLFDSHMSKSSTMSFSSPVSTSSTVLFSSPASTSSTVLFSSPVSMSSTVLFSSPVSMSSTVLFSSPVSMSSTVLFSSPVTMSSTVSFISPVSKSSAVIMKDNKIPSFPASIDKSSCSIRELHHLFPFTTASAMGTSSPTPPTAGVSSPCSTPSSCGCSVTGSEWRCGEAPTPTYTLQTVRDNNQVVWLSDGGGGRQCAAGHVGDCDGCYGRDTSEGKCDACITSSCCELSSIFTLPSSAGVPTSTSVASSPIPSPTGISSTSRAVLGRLHAASHPGLSSLSSPVGLSPSSFTTGVSAPVVAGTSSSLGVSTSVNILISSNLSSSSLSLLSMGLSSSSISTSVLPPVSFDVSSSPSLISTGVLKKEINIIDANREDNCPVERSESCALKAMESFIRRSFVVHTVSSVQTTWNHPEYSVGKPSFCSMGSSYMCVSPSTPSPSNHLAELPTFCLPRTTLQSSKYLDLSANITNSTGKPIPLIPCQDKKPLLDTGSSVDIESSVDTGQTQSCSLNSNLIPYSKYSLNSSRSKHVFCETPLDTVNTSDRTVGGMSDKISPVSHRVVDVKDEGKLSSKVARKRGITVEDIIPANDLVGKYLCMDDDGRSDRLNGSEGVAMGLCNTKSPLESLSRFVNAQPMSTEHPLDSLQKLLTRSNITNMMGLSLLSPFHHRYLCGQSIDAVSVSSTAHPPDVSSVADHYPLNLSTKLPESSELSFSNHNPASFIEGETCNPSILLDQECVGSPDEEFDHEEDLTEYTCSGCNRMFASKGSYLYHLSRCHLSSVKRLGLNDALNMSPYVYLPLDHTAKFSKYYMLAEELAGKGKVLKND